MKLKLHHDSVQGPTDASEAEKKRGQYPKEFPIAVRAIRSPCERLNDTPRKYLVQTNKGVLSKHLEPLKKEGL